MKKIVKWLFILFILLPVLLFAIAWTAFQMTPQEKIRGLIGQQIGQKLNRELRIGPAHLTWQGLVLDTLEVSEIPTFKAGTFFTAQGVDLGWGLRNLWNGFDFKTKTLTRSSGHFQMSHFDNPHYLADHFTVHWALTNIDSTGKHLNGWATLEQQEGVFRHIDELMATSPSAKMALTPVMALMNLDKLGAIKLGLPDLRYWPVQSIHGDYVFNKGTMTIRSFIIRSAQVDLLTAGTVDLGSGGLLLDVQLHSPKNTMMGSLDAKLRVTGTISHPKADLNSLKKKVFRATLENILNDPKARDALKNLFR